MNLPSLLTRYSFFAKHLSLIILVYFMSGQPCTGQDQSQSPPAKPELPDVPAEIQKHLSDAATLLEKGQPEEAMNLIKKYRDWEETAFSTNYKNKYESQQRSQLIQKQSMAAMFEQQKAKAEAALQAGDAEAVEFMSWTHFSLDQGQNKWVQALRPKIEEVKKKSNEAKFAKWQGAVLAFVAEAQSTCAACTDEASLEGVYSKAIALGSAPASLGQNHEQIQRYSAKLDTVKFTTKLLIDVLNHRAMGREGDSLDALGKLTDDVGEKRGILKLSQLKELETRFGMTRLGEKLAKLTTPKDIDELETTIKEASKAELNRLSIYPDRALLQLKGLKQIAASLAEGNSKSGLQGVRTYLNSSDTISNVRSIASGLRQAALEMEIKKYTGQLPAANTTISQHLITALEAAINKEDLATAESVIDLLQGEFSKEFPNAAAESLALKDWAAAKRYEEANDFQMATRYWRKIIGTVGLKYVPMAKFQKRLAEQIAAHPEVSAPGVDNLLQEMQQLRLEVRKLSDLLIRK